MDLRFRGSPALAAAALLACSSAYSPPDNSYPGGAGGGNGHFVGGGPASGGGSSGGESTSGASGGGTSAGSSSSGSGTTSASGTSSSGGSSSGGSTTGGSGNQLLGLLAFPVASAGQFLPAADGGVTSQMEIDMASFVLDCSGLDGGLVAPPGSTLALTLYSGSPNAAVASGTYYVLPPPGPGIPYAAATLFTTDVLGQTTIMATGQSGPVIWSPSFSGAASGTLAVVMSAGNTMSVLSGSFVAPYCGSF